MVEEPIKIIKPKDVVRESKPSFQRPVSISITSPANNPTQESKSVENKTEATVYQNQEYTSEELNNAWKKFADTIPEQVRMTSFIQNTVPVLTPNSTFEVTVSNILQERELKRLQPDIQNFMQSILNNSSVRMTIKIIEESAVQRANSPEDRYKLFAEQNPALDILKNNLNLEID
ncbi:MAG: hypothetical protein PHS59_03105 [Paludibacter sp.]|nr:hypothetical protein [Paludibacter sp.]